MRFRFHRVALVADIEKAFLMVSISPSDRDALRFIWLDDIHKDNPKEVVYRFFRVVFGVTSSPFLLNATIKQHLQKYANGIPELVKVLLNSLYVDDMTSGESTIARFCRVVFGVASSPFLLNATIKQHLQKYANGNPELVKALLNSLYVDDMTSGESTIEREFDLFVKSRKIMAEGGFNLRK